MLKAVIFDMDGVIIDSEAIYLEKYLKFARRKNPAVTWEDLIPTVGASHVDEWIIIKNAIGTEQTWEELRDEFRSTHIITDGIDYRAIFRPVIRNILIELQSMGMKLAVASSSRRMIIEHVLSINDIADFFSVVVSGTEFTQSKPNPEIYLHTMAQLGVRPEECLAIEDSTFGVMAAHASGAHVAALKDPRFHFDQTLADWRMESLTEILNIAGGLL